MSVIISDKKRGELAISSELTLTDTETGTQLPLCVLTLFVDEKGYRIGDIVDDGEVEEIVTASRVYDCAVAGVKLLSYSDNSVRGLSRKLVTREYERVCADEAARALSELGYINEREQIERRGRNIAERKLRGSRRVAADLASLGYDREAIEEWERECGINYAEICARAIMRRGGLPPRSDTDGRKRLISYLYRQGFSGEDIRAAAIMIVDAKETK